MKIGKGISCTIKSPPFLACLYISHQVKRAFVGELHRLVLTTQLLLVDCFSSCKFQVVATVALIVHHSVAIIPMPYTELKQLCCCYFSRSLMIMCVRNTELLLSLEASEMSAVITQCAKFTKKIMANRV